MISLKIFSNSSLNAFNLFDSDNPRLHGKGLTANRLGQWRYRIGDYRLICDIQDNKLVIVMIDVGHRREIY